MKHNIEIVTAFFQHKINTMNNLRLISLKYFYAIR